MAKCGIEPDMEKSWCRFPMDGRVIEWKVERFGSDRRLVIRSQTRCFHVEAPIRDNIFAKWQGEAPSVIFSPLVIGKEFPLGVLIDVPPKFSGAFEIAKHGTVHTELVRSLIGRWTHRRRFTRAGRAT